MSDAARLPASFDDDLVRNEPGALADLAEEDPDDHPDDCDGSLTVPDAGFGGQDITYNCPHPSHDPWGFHDPNPYP